MKKSILKISLISIMVFILAGTISFATVSKLKLSTSTDKDTYEVGDLVTVTINWTEEMEAAGATLKYDENKVNFKSSSLQENFYNSTTAGEITFN